MTYTSGAPAWIVLGRTASATGWVALDGSGTRVETGEVADADLGAWVTAREAAASIRWVWHDTTAWYPRLLADGIRIARCHDLRLCHAILARGAADPASPWSRAPIGAERADEALFALDGSIGAGGAPDDIDAAVAEFSRQLGILEASRDAGRVRLLLAAESAGALCAVELRTAGAPWDAGIHHDILVATLGEPGRAGRRPERIEERAREVREALGDPTASLDSQPKLLRALHRVGVLATSTSKWELAEYDHPVIEPLLDYKRLMRMFTANGWEWLREWGGDGRFRPVYVPGGVVTGRWASTGGGALQLPRALRPALRADPGWTLVIADVAQLEPRVLAAMARDTALAQAAGAGDLYAGIAGSGVVATRDEAKLALLGAMYGATTGDSGRLVPTLRRAYPRAMGLVDDAATTGESGGIVETWLGRVSPPPTAAWRAVQSRAGDPDAAETERARARQSARNRGRFTRNFVVQGTAAEWALAWLADLRLRLGALEDVAESESAPASGPAFARRAHLAYFLHDEIIVHAPATQADAAAACVRDAAASATRLMFGGFPIELPLDLRIAEDAGKG